MKATLFQIQRACTEDGPGIRTTLFFKGCPLRCRWCQNPESISFSPWICWNRERCMGCQGCIAACPEGALAMDGNRLHMDRKACVACGNCIQCCPGDARQMLGHTWRLDALMDELLRDRAYYRRSGGGVTLSGGEPGAQPEFAAALLDRLAGAGVHTALDTSGWMEREIWRDLVARSDMVICDIKEIDPARHRRLTGRGNAPILENLQFLARHMPAARRPTRLWIRTPIIPRATAREETVAAIGRFIARHLADVVERWELCAFNHLCAHKYQWLDQRWEYDGCIPIGGQTMATLGEAARNSGVDPAIVRVGGVT